MKIKYKFATDEEVEIEVSDEWSAIIIELNHQDYNIDHRETRRHTSLDGMDYEGEFFTDSSIDILAQMLQDEKYSSLYAAIAKLKPEQQAMVQAILFKGMSVSDYADQQGVDHSAISHRLRTVYKKLKLFL